MADSHFRLVGRGLGALAAASLLAGVSLDAAAYGSQGKIRLQLGGGQQSRFLYEDAGGVALASQGFRVQPGTKCFLGWANGAKDLVSFDAIGPTGAISPQLGMGPDSIGVYDNSKGVSCYRMTGTIQEGVDLTLDGTDLPAGTYFDRLELDVEVKQNAELILQVFKTGAPDPLGTYTLRSGNRIISGQGSSGESSPQDTIYNCGATSDSGPDSGASDNCRWVINDVGNRFTLRPKIGTDSEVSLEGGGDFSNPTANNTIIYLTKLIDTGNLYCSPNSNPSFDNQTDEVGGGSVASCQTTRINPNNLPGQAGICDGPITYALETFLGESSCELRKADNTPHVQFAGSIQITFKPEDSVSWAPDPTQIVFRLKDGSDSAPFTVEACNDGTVVDDANGNSTILEVLASPTPAWVVDQDPAADTIAWACVLDNRHIYIGDELMQVTQTILYWGDIKFERL